MLFKNDSLHRWLFLWDLFSENQSEPRDDPFNQSEVGIDYQILSVEPYILTIVKPSM